MAGINLRKKDFPESPIGELDLKISTFALLDKLASLHRSASHAEHECYSDGCKAWEGNKENHQMVENSALWQDIYPLWLFSEKGKLMPMHRHPDDLFGDLAMWILAAEPITEFHGLEDINTLGIVIVRFLAKLKLIFGVDFEADEQKLEWPVQAFSDWIVSLTSGWYPQVHHKHLTETELCLLANLTNPGTLRNARYDTSNPLSFIKDGKTLLIEVPEARRWLTVRQEQAGRKYEAANNPLSWKAITSDVKEETAMFKVIDTTEPRKTIMNSYQGAPFMDELLYAEEDNVQVYYSPFEYVNEKAKIVLVGISPGETQAKNANDAFQEAIRDGHSTQEALKVAKCVASFSGPLRHNLVKLLNHIGVPSLLGVNDCAELFGDAADLVHYTSVFMFPTLKNGLPVSTAKSVKLPETAELLFDYQLKHEAAILKDALWIPLGQGVANQLMNLVNQKLLKKEQVLTGLPHPSGANAERISYFLGEKSRELLSSKTNPDALDTCRNQLIKQINSLSEGIAQSKTISLNQVITNEVNLEEPEEKQYLQIEASEHMIKKVPQSRDGTVFHRGLERRGKYTIGAKGEEEAVSDYEEALQRLATMDVPRWRRPNAKGNWGIVAGIRWIDEEK